MLAHAVIRANRCPVRLSVPAPSLFSCLLTGKCSRDILLGGHPRIYPGPSREGILL